MEVLLAAARRRRGNDPPVWFFIAMAVAIIAIIAIAASVSKRRRRKRAEAMERIAGELGLEYRPLGSDGLVEQLGHFQLFSKGRGRKALNMLKGGDCGARRLAIFDYQYTTGGGKSTHTFYTTVLSLGFEEGRMPEFMLRRKQVGDTIASWFRGRGIEFAGRPMFSRRYLLRGENETGIREVFTEPVVEYFEENPGLFVEAAGSEILIYRLGQKVRPEGIKEFLGKGLELVGLMRAG